MGFMLLLGALSLAAFFGDFSDSDEEGDAAPEPEIEKGDPPSGSDAGNDEAGDGVEQSDIDLASATSVIVGEEGGFNIELEFEGEWTLEEKEQVVLAAEEVAALVHEDIPDVKAGDKEIDDLVIKARVSDDLGNGALGLGGFTSVRAGSYLPAQGEITILRQDDPTEGTFYDTAVHEMLHAMGFGLIWEPLGLVSDDNIEPRFTGQKATEVYEEMVQNGEIVDPNAAAGVPISFGDEAHWDEATLTSEIMTPYLDPGSELSDLTIAALEDMGYVTDFHVSNLFFEEASTIMPFSAGV
ncbi:MAG: hypothetical protein AAF841_01695 [Pseudomonadota bacterium]